MEIHESLGHGGMGAVYKARQDKLDRLVALKIIRPESADNPAFAERFSREARTLAQLCHPNIVAVYDFGEVMFSDANAEDATPHTLYYFLMEYVDGANLRQLMQSGDLQSGAALAIIPQICEALQYAHGEGVVHRDIKPENILVGTKGQVKIADFGLARLVASSAKHVTLTGTHQVMGTPRYMAPEQMAGSHDVDHRADIYSLGVVFYEMLTGEVPMGQFEPPSKKAPVDGRLDKVVLRALAREPERRFQQASELKSSIEEISSHPNLPQHVAISTVVGPQAQNGSQWTAGGLGRVVKQRPEILDVLMIIMCLSGALMIALPWLDVKIVEPENAHWAPRTATVAAYRVWSGIATAGAFAGLALLLIITPIKKRVRIWWPVAMTGLAAIALLLTFLVRKEIESRPYSFIAWEGDSPELLFYSVPLRELEHRITFRAGFYGALGLSVSLLLMGAIAIRRETSQSGELRGNTQSTDPPLTSLRFTVATNQDIGPQVVFHFSGLGYRLVDEQPKAWVFQRGNRFGGFWTSPFCTDIHTYYTTLTINTTSGKKGDLLVSCVWAVRTWGAWFGGRDIRRLEAEGGELKSLLGGSDDRKSVELETMTPPTYSVAAIIGAVLSLITMAVAVFGYIVIWQDQIVIAEEPQTTNWTLFLVLGGFVVITGSITTLLGIVSMNDIRNSNGSVTGRGLAFAVAILFPLLVLDAMIYGFLLVLTTEFAPESSSMTVVSVPLIWLIADFLLIILAWRITLLALDAPGESLASVQDEQRRSTEKSPDGKPPRRGTGR